MRATLTFPRRASPAPAVQARARAQTQALPRSGFGVNHPEEFGFVYAAAVQFGVMAQRAFEELSKKLGTAFFRADSKAFQALQPRAP